MLLEIAEEVFSEENDHQVSLFNILTFTVEARHTWLPDPAVAQVAIGYLQDNFPKKVDWQTYIANASKASAWQGRENRQPVLITDENVTTIAHDLSQPAVVVVENARNDGSFLRAVLAAYRPEMKAAVEKNWLHIDHSGGTGEQAAIADEAAARFHHVCRVLVVKDNDARRSFPRRSPDSVDWDIPDEPIVHIWSRLEVENYLPDAVLVYSDHPQADELLRSLRQMSTQAQGWIDMKKGLEKTPLRFVGALAPEAEKVWRMGYRKQLPSPLIPQGLELTVDDFRSLGDDVHDELLYLLALIARVL
ncbi:hypothetical protein F4553_002102 [Allocatelliglobosispora scoriae]|uniref:Uncharacterized protein n=1 Tax=Allocatelliglobosispora scoriae TaxID=643052 RepID=A0A841BP44_9ACTN|nr:hypothetical protein [Allocatelliglobosispora scoriae]MBB5868723.1 hypothetical protein [Allocatelliglobosispora scoriae]